MSCRLARVGVLGARHAHTDLLIEDLERALDVMCLRTVGSELRMLESWHVIQASFPEFDRFTVDGPS